MAFRFVSNAMARLTGVVFVALLSAGISRQAAAQVPGTSPAVGSPPAVGAAPPFGAAQSVGVQTFLAEPGALLRQNPAGGSALISQIRDLAVANPSTLQPIINLLCRTAAGPAPPPAQTGSMG